MLIFGEFPCEPHSMLLNQKAGESLLGSYNIHPWVHSNISLDHLTSVWFPDSTVHIQEIKIHPSFGENLMPKRFYTSPQWRNIYSKELQKLFKHIGHICVTPFFKRGVEEWKLLCNGPPFLWCSCNSSSKSKKTEHDFLLFCGKVFPMEALERVSTCYTNVTSQLGDVCVESVETKVRTLPLFHEKLGFSFFYSPLPTRAQNWKGFFTDS